MAIQKKHGKGRLDKWYKLAKEKGYRARAAFKLIQLNKKYGFLEKSKVLLDLCAAPGSWCQVAAEVMPVNSLIVGVDLAPIKPIPKVITFQSDISSDQCRATIRKHLQTWKADTVLHDGAPNVGTAWVQDSFNQAELTLQAMRLATDFLIEGGTFVTKLFRSKDYNSLLWVFNQLFAKIEATKPPSSRNVSAEIFVVCRGFKAPKRIDPSFLDPRAVFEELASPATNNEAKVYNPDVKKRKRDGYEDGDWTQFKEIPATDFIQSSDPIDILGTINRLTFAQSKNGDVALAALDKLPETSDEIRTCCQDLKVLGRKDFKLLLKWRLKVRHIFGFPTKDSKKDPELAEETIEVASMDEDMKIQDLLRDLNDKETARKKRERRRANELRQKDIVRMQLNMTAPMDIGMEQQGPVGDDAIFQLKIVDQAGALGRISKGKMVKVAEHDSKKDRDSGLGISADSDDESNDAEDRLERELDSMYDDYKDRKAATDAKYRAKRAKEEHHDDEWEGVSGDDQAGSNHESSLEEDSNEDSDADDSNADDDLPGKTSLLTDLEKDTGEATALSKRARAFFNQDLFKDVEGLLNDIPDEDGPLHIENGKGVQRAETMELDENSSDEKIIRDKPTDKKHGTASDACGTDKGHGREAAKRRKQVADEDEEEHDWEEEDRRQQRERDNRPEIDIITAEAMTLAHELATGKKSSHNLIDDGFNKHAFRDRDGLPDWFVEDESRHDRPQKPITKAAAQAIKEKLRALNARPIKKVREAKARKKLRAANRLEKLKKKSDLLAASDAMTERDKADSIAKLLAKAGKKTRRQPVKVVVAKGPNKGKGRPNGVKGRYKMVDSRMKKELRALRRKAKSQK